MVAWALSRAVQLLLGTLYPAYASYKAVRNKDVREYVRWMMYWIVFALFMATETVTDTFFSWFPFYYEIKMAFVVWLLSPYTKGASLLYRKFVHPTLSSKEKEIDHFICQAKERGYESLVSFGKKSINVAATAAIQGQGALAGRLRSFSMQDLRSIPETAMVHYSDPLYLEEQGLCRQPIGRRPAAQQPGSDSEEEEDCWTDSEVSGPSRGRCRDPALPKPLARSQSFRQVKKRPPAKEVRRLGGGRWRGSPRLAPARRGKSCLALPKRCWAPPFRRLLLGGSELVPGSRGRTKSPRLPRRRGGQGLRPGHHPTSSSGSPRGQSSPACGVRAEEEPLHRCGLPTSLS